MIAPAIQFRLTNGLVAGEETDPNQSHAARYAICRGVHLSAPAEFCGRTLWCVAMAKLCNTDSGSKNITLTSTQHLMHRMPCREAVRHACCKQLSALHSLYTALQCTGWLQHAVLPQHPNSDACLALGRLLRGGAGLLNE